MQALSVSCQQDSSLAFQGAEIYQEKKNSKCVEVLLYACCDELCTALTLFRKNLAVYIAVQSPGPSIQVLFFQRSQYQISKKMQKKTWKPKQRII